ncbi:hypothetical protein ACIP4T_31900, partial [Streptomyces massasporeus]|uniref:hypothetical protein n=1 Tax=Streptomyces massasporeus TaxID=67324 RepID=UPI0036E088B7
AAMRRMCPAGMSRTAETGAGLSNFCIVALLGSASFRRFQRWKSYVAFTQRATSSLHAKHIITAQSQEFIATTLPPNATTALTPLQ